MNAKTPSAETHPDWMLDLDRQNAAAFANIRTRYNQASGSKDKPAEPNDAGVSRMLARGKRRVSDARSFDNE